jgi:hypothetical protein
MQLRHLRPKEGANLEHLKTLIDGRGWRSALPESLPDALLLRLARDFRGVEASVCDPSTEGDGKTSFAAAIYVLMNLLMQHPARNGDNGQMDISVPGVMHALQLYQLDLEREIVTRIVGVSRPSQTKSLLDGLWRCVEE